MNPELNDSIVAHLQELGWSRADGAAIATKIYPTGEATAHFSSFDAARNWTLSGCYWSEGRNVLEPHSALITKTAPSAAVADLVRDWATKVDRVVADSYAARLLIKFDFIDRVVPESSYATRLRLEFGSSV